jgi:peptidylprolyl isomerase
LKGIEMRIIFTAVIAVFITVAFLSAQAPQATQTQIPAPDDVAAPPKDAIKTKSGLITKVISPGTGTDRPESLDTVTVHYTGWTTDGKMFDSSVARGKPSTFPVNRVIPGWGETVQLMTTGEKRRAWIPEKLAYKGQEGRPKGLLVFDIELISFVPSPTKAPADVKAPPTDAIKTKSGISYKSIQKGTGATHPTTKSRVTVNYTGWTTDGKMFDSSIPSNKPASFPLDQVIEGWTEGLQLMVEGQKMRFWIPERLAYKGKQAPFGMLIFDVELLKIE